MANARPAIVGAFVLSGLALGFGAVLLFGGTQLFSRTQHAVVYFQASVAGLEVGAPVTFRGVRVGSVTAVAVHIDARTLKARIPVYIELDPSEVSLDDRDPSHTGSDFDRLLKAGLRAQLNMQSLITGELRVDLDVQPGIATPVEATVSGLPVIPSSPSQLQTLEDEIAALPLKQIAANAEQALAAIQRAADAVAPKLGPLADSLQQTSDAARATLHHIDTLAIAGQGQLRVSGAELAKVLAASDRTVEQAGALTQSMRNLTAPDSQLRANLEAAMRDLAASAGAMRSFTHQIARNPSIVLLGRHAP
jgi:paraquat-inducible protein B